MLLLDTLDFDIGKFEISNELLEKGLIKVFGVSTDLRNYR
ncbi:hypothetical protein IFVP18_C130047 [Vibrio parahaemolyticus]